MLAFSSLETLAEQTNLDVYFFYSETCPHCARQELLMPAIDAHNPDIKVHFGEVSRHPQAWQRFRAQYNIASTAVPITFVEETTFVGYSESEGPLEYSPVYAGFVGYRNQIIGAIAQAAGHEIQLAAIESLRGQFPWFALVIPLLYLASLPLVRDHLQQPQTRRYWLGGLAAVCILSLFLMASLTPEAVIRDFAHFPLFISIIALADGFNPCAFTVLVILLSLLAYTDQRRDMMLVGGTFITTSAVMYFLFILVMIAVGSVLLEQYGAIVL